MVTDKIENHLIHSSLIENTKILWIAENYRLWKVIRELIPKIPFSARGRMEKSPFFDELSVATQQKITAHKL
uniref:Cytochrome P450 n=1 Tax=Caenorhabditis tropicalis TaxID=1561998 RepID=A0A1I7U264_9PELO